jgi:hypothetical protein
MEPKKITRWNPNYSLEWCYVCNRRIFPSVLPHRRNRLNLCLEPNECKKILNDIDFAIFKFPTENDKNDELVIYNKNREYLGKLSYKFLENKIIIINTNLDIKTKYSKLFIKIQDFLKKPEVFFMEDDSVNIQSDNIDDNLPDFY